MSANPNNQPWSFAQATDNCRKAAIAQENAEQSLRDAARAFAEAEEKYRKALAVEIVTSHGDGVAWSTAPDLARGDAEVARLRMERDVAEGVREALTHALWRHNANRRDAQRFADWSQRRELAEAAGTVSEPEAVETIGARAA